MNDDIPTVHIRLNVKVLNLFCFLDLLIFVLPHQFIKRSCAPLAGKLKSSAKALSLVKGNATKQICPQVA